MTNTTYFARSRTTWGRGATVEEAVAEFKKHGGKLKDLKPVKKGPRIGPQPITKVTTEDNVEVIMYGSGPIGVEGDGDLLATKYEYATYPELDFKPEKV